ncbi:hypothetical protein GKZ68_10435 [Hymenobacter sp. BRD128]|uniref:hypothetical protein n=1 Tax=Hymenobacter sp. BRD128 TaxID=2675878 RepID=UPI0015659114|nr:hypothetical protein [Hymenobacter sp. BRD128]QKG57007.1 hypothetical protein GKZ68_10435 [Hymenobacter sp. BRD128]
MSTAINFVLRLEDLLGPKVAAAIREVQKLGQQVEKPHKMNVDTSAAKSGLQGIKSLLGGLGLAFGAFEAFNFLKDSVTKFNEADQAGAQFEATLKSTKGAVGLTKEELLGLSTALMGKSLFDDDAITQAQSVLLTFTNIKGSVYKDALPAITDLATKMGGDLQGATVQVGKALNDPIKGITALQRVGVSFSESQKATIKNLVLTGHTVEAQGMILKELGTEFGGSAEAASKAGTGGWTVLKNKFDNIRESIGGLLSQGAGSGLPILNTLVDQGQKAVDWIGAHLDGVKEAFRPLKEALQPLLDTFQDLWAQQYGNGEAGDVLATVFNRIGTAVRLISPVIKIAATLLGKVWEEGQHVVNVLTKFWESSPRLKKFFSGFYEGALATFKGIAEAVGKYLGGVGDFIEGIFTGDFSKIKDGLKQTLSAIADTQHVGEKAADGFVKGYKKGFDKTDLFAVKGSVAVENSASKFMAGDKPGASHAQAMTADASKGAVGGSVGGSKVTNITLRIDTLMREVKLSGTTMGESVQDLAQKIRDTVVAELLDVNTLTSN